MSKEESVQVKVSVGLHKKYVQHLRDQAADFLAEFTDESIVEMLAENILERYFNTEYFDTDALYN